MAGNGPEEEVGQNRPGRAIGTSIRGNSTAFGFSIMITATFGVINHLEGAPNLLQLFLFGAGAATAIAALEGVVTKGFRAAIEQTSQEVKMLGTAMNLVSVAAGTAAALGVAELMDGTAVWPLATFAAAIAYVSSESLELLLAEEIQGARGAPVRESDEEES